MSLATRCTHCGTIFKVVQDQLKVSEGWVRCGRCHEVFNAVPSLFDLDNEPPPPRRTAPVPPPAPVTAPTPTAMPPRDAAYDEAFDEDADMGGDPHAGPVPDDTPSPASPPAGLGRWSSTQPTDLAPPTAIADHTPLTAADLEMPGSLPAATDFDLDTRVGTAPAPAADDSPYDPVEDPADADGALDGLDDVPDMDESDALDSRYLMPSRDARPVRHRDGPEFADAQFPSDAMQDAEDEAWLAAAQPRPMPIPSGLRGATGAPTRPATPAPAALRAPAPAPNEDEVSTLSSDPADDASLPTTQPSRFGEDYVPEQGLAPPSQRKGKSGTRGRDPSLHTPEFLRRAQRKAFWRHPATRAVLLTVLLVLVAGLGLQLAHQFRDLIAAYHPQTRPLLTQWCEQVGCQLQPVRRLEALQVDNAALVRTASEGPDRYRLSVTVHNRAEIELAWPHVDLTLTDEQGAVIARRTFSPQDARLVPGEGKATAPLPGTVPSQQSTTLQWSLQLRDLSPAGYTAELFYP